MVRSYKMFLDKNKHPILVEEQVFKYSDDVANTPGKIVDLVNECFKLNKRAEEHLVLLALDSKCRILGIFEVSHGSVNQSISGTREIFQRALICGAVQIVLVHNHPSGNVKPSRADQTAYEKIREAGQLMSVMLVDFLIVGDENYYSFEENKSSQRL